LRYIILTILLAIPQRFPQRDGSQQDGNLLPKHFTTSKRVFSGDMVKTKAFTGFVSVTSSVFRWSYGDLNSKAVWN